MNCGSMISRLIAAAISASDAVEGKRSPAPFASTRAAFAAWSRAIGRMSCGRPLTSERVTVDKPQERLEEDRQTIVTVAEGIRAERFPAKPDRMKCSGCDFRLLCPSSAV